jgi:polysaccharide export outer membrane protein
MAQRSRTPFERDASPAPGARRLRAPRATPAKGLAALLVAAILASASAQVTQPAVVDYVVGPQDVLMITCYDQADLSGRFTVEADGSFTYPLVGRIGAGGLTLRQVELEVKRRLQEGFFKNPQITVTVETYRSRKIFVMGEVRQPGAYTLSGDMTLVEALARAGSTLPSAGSEAIVVHATDRAGGPTMPNQADARNVVRLDLTDLEQGALALNMTLRDGDTIVVPRAPSVYVFGHVKNPGAYALQQKNTTVLQALSLAGGVTDRGSLSRLRIVRIVKGKKEEFKVGLTDIIQPGDTIVVPERYL